MAQAKGKRDAYNRAYYRKHREEINAEKKACRAAQRAAGERVVRQLSPEAAQRAKVKKAAEMRAYRAKHRARLLADKRAYAAAHAKERAAYRAAHHEEMRAKNHAYRARKRAINGTYTADEWNALCAWFGRVCLACGVNEGLTVDHVVPFSSGGHNDISNIQPLCSACNGRKAAKTTDYRDPVALSAFLESLRSQP